MVKKVRNVISQKADKPEHKSPLPATQKKKQQEAPKAEAPVFDEDEEERKDEEDW